MSEETSKLAAPARVAPGTRIRQYEVLRELGRGGMGTVFAAIDVKLGRQVAIKVLHGTTRAIAERFLVEARATARCSHENIVIVHEVDEHDGIPYMVLELLEGQSLRELMRERALDQSRVVDVMLPVARALARAHELGFVHRDLKPENVFVTRAGQVKVLDFGIAKALGDPQRAATEPGRETGILAASLPLTQEGSIVGTLAYMSPEQLHGDVDHRSDLWSFGLITFELLARRHPIQPQTNEALFDNLLSDDPMPPLRSVEPAISRGLAEIVDQCIAKSVGERIASAAEVVRRLEVLRTATLSIAVTPVTAIASAAPRPRRWPVVAAALAAVVLAAVIAVVVTRDDSVTPEPVVLPAAPREPIPAPPPPVPPPPPVAGVERPAPVVRGPARKPPVKPARKPPRKPEPRAGSGSAAPCNVFRERVGC